MHIFSNRVYESDSDCVYDRIFTTEVKNPNLIKATSPTSRYREQINKHFIIIFQATILCITLSQRTTIVE